MLIKKIYFLLIFLTCLARDTDIINDESQLVLGNIDRLYDQKNLDKNQSSSSDIIEKKSSAVPYVNSTVKNKRISTLRKNKMNKKKLSLFKKKVNKKKIREMYKKMTPAQRLNLKKRLNQRQDVILQKEKNNKIVPATKQLSQEKSPTGVKSSVSQVSQPVINTKTISKNDPQGMVVNSNQKKNKDEVRNLKNIANNTLEKGNNQPQQNELQEIDLRNFPILNDFDHKVFEKDDLMKQKTDGDGIAKKLLESVTEISKLSKDLSDKNFIENNIAYSDEIKNIINKINNFAQVDTNTILLPLPQEIQDIIQTYNNNRSIVVSSLANNQAANQNEFDLNELIKQLNKKEKLDKKNLLKYQQHVVNQVKKMEELGEDGLKKVIDVLKNLFANPDQEIIGSHKEALFVPTASQGVSNNDTNFKKLLFLVHPDKNNGVSEAAKKSLRIVFADLNNMKQVANNTNSIHKVKEIIHSIKNIYQINKISNSIQKVNIIQNIDTAKNTILKGQGLPKTRVDLAQALKEFSAQPAAQKSLLAIENGPVVATVDQSNLALNKDFIPSIPGNMSAVSSESSADIGKGASSRMNKEGVQNQIVLNDKLIEHTHVDDMKKYLSEFTPDEVAKIMDLGNKKITRIRDHSKIKLLLPSKIKLLLPYFPKLKDVLISNFDLVVDLLLGSKDQAANDRIFVGETALQNKFHDLFMVGNKLDQNKVSLFKAATESQRDQIFQVAKILDNNELQSLSVNLFEKLLQLNKKIELNKLSCFTGNMLATLEPDVVITLLDTLSNKFLLYIKDVFDKAEYENLYNLIIKNKQRIVSILENFPDNLQIKNQKPLLKKLLPILTWLQEKQKNVIDSWDPKKLVILIKNMDVHYLQNLSNEVLSELQDYDNDKFDIVTSKINNDYSKNFSVRFAKALKSLDKEKIDRLDKIGMEKKSFLSKLFSSISEENAVAVLEVFNEAQLDALESDVAEVIGKQMIREKIRALQKLSNEQLKNISVCYINKLKSLPVDHIESLALINPEDITQANCQKITDYISTYKKNMIEKFHNKNIKGFDNPFVMKYSQQLQNMSDDLFNKYITPDSIKALAVSPELFDIMTTLDQNAFFNIIEKINSSKNNIYLKIKKMLSNKSIKKDDLFKKDILDKIDLVSDDFLDHKNSMSILDKIDIEYLQIKLDLEKECMKHIFAMIDSLDKNTVKKLFSYCFNDFSNKMNKNFTQEELNSIKNRFLKLFCQNYFDTADLKKLAELDQNDFIILLDEINAKFYAVLKTHFDDIKKYFKGKMDVFIRLPLESIPIFENQIIWNFLKKHPEDIKKISLLESDRIKDNAGNNYFDVLLTIAVCTKDAITKMKTLNNDQRKYISEKISNILDLGDPNILNTYHNRFDALWIDDTLQEYDKLLSVNSNNFIKPFSYNFIKPFSYVGQFMNKEPLKNTDLKDKYFKSGLDIIHNRLI